MAEANSTSMDVDGEARLLVPPTFSDMLEVIQDESGIPFKKCVISVDSLINDEDFLPNEEELFSLDFLNELRLPAHSQQPAPQPAPRQGKKKGNNKRKRKKKILRDFLPKTIYVRPEMRTMFPKFVEEYDGDKGEISRVLVGSPGIGKSVLFFLAALGRARSDEERIVMYFRMVDGELSVFVMEAGENSGEVNVLVSRNMDKREFSNLNEISLSMTRPTNLDEDNFFFMLDGPHHDAPKEDLLNKSYDALCTSGGFPVPRQEVLLAITIHVLSGWTETAILSALAKLGVPQADADEAYALCGGRIRLAVMAIQNQRHEVTDWFDSLVADLGTNAIELAIKQKGSAGASESSDRLRTRFFNDDDGSNIMVVDSLYLLQQLKQRLQPAAFIDAYNLAHACQLYSARGWFYEEILHRWFEGKVLDTNIPKIVGFSRKEDITGASSVKELVDLFVRGEGEGVYWVPSIPNFANIDAAILLGSVLNCIQDTVKPFHDFKTDTFWTGFVGQLVETGVVLTDVNVWFVTPSDINFQNSHDDYTQQYLLPATRASAPTNPTASVVVRFHVYHIDAGSAAALDRSATTIPFLAN